MLGGQDEEEKEGMQSVKVSNLSPIIVAVFLILGIPNEHCACACADCRIMDGLHLWHATAIA